MIETLIASTLAFISTNIDDIFILMLFYGTGKFKSSQIIGGQYLGIAVLVLLSLLGSFIGNFVDQRYVGLLGLFPVYLAIKQVYQLVNHKDDQADEREIKTDNGVISIAFVTIANGADNIGVYVPLLATYTMVEKIGFAIVFLVMVFIWCQIARSLARHPLMAKALNTYGHIIMPVVLFLLGVFILYESASFSLLSHLN